MVHKRTMRILKLNNVISTERATRILLDGAISISNTQTCYILKDDQ